MIVRASGPLSRFSIFLLLNMFARLSIAVCLLASLTSLGVLSNPIVVRDSPISLPVAKRFNATGIANILKTDQARAHALKKNVQNANTGVEARRLSATDAAFGIPSTSYATEYVVNVTVGNPPRPFRLLVDTGSSNTWIGANQILRPPPSARDTGNSLWVEYGSGIVTGEQWVDSITLAPGLTVHNQSFGIALLAVGFETVDGILGLGPQVLTYGSLFPDATAFVPTVTDNAFAQGLIGAHSIGISFAPSKTLDGVTNGEISFGGVNDSKYTGEINFVPLTTTYPSSLYVGINQTITYGASKLPILSNNAGITDTGTTLLLIATDALQAYQAATGAEADPDIGLLRLTPAQFSKLESLFFTIGKETYEFTANAQIWPRELNSAIGGTDDFVYLIVADIGTPSGYGMDFIDGMSFLERFYSVYDAGANRFGIANTEFTLS
ncbi:unnamed protein product [Somion occarium]|uniref:Peptidase A1 domain-containing protein n=1 Tax=Somion occarium TaxID=3059160 RepID=A0ABP1DT68_9APHY